MTDSVVTRRWHLMTASVPLGLLEQPQIEAAVVVLDHVEERRASGSLGAASERRCRYQVVQRNPVSIQSSRELLSRNDKLQEEIT